MWRSIVLPVRAAHRMMNRVARWLVADGDDEVTGELASMPG